MHGNSQFRDKQEKKKAGIEMTAFSRTPMLMQA